MERIAGDVEAGHLGVGDLEALLEGARVERTRDLEPGPCRCRANRPDSGIVAHVLKGAWIIITTIQKFGIEHLATISGQAGRNFAVIIDEAHSSQSGKAAQAMSDAQTRDAINSDDIENLVLAFQKARVPQNNISYQTPAGFALHLTAAIARPAARDENSAGRAIAYPAPKGINDHRAPVAAE